jgi:hypothetical protein
LQPPCRPRYFPAASGGRFAFDGDRGDEPMKKRSRFLAVVALAAFLAIVAQGGPASAQTSLGFTNGSFEEGVSGSVSPFTSSTGWNTWLGPASSGSDYGVAMSSTPPKVAENGSFYAFFHANQNITDCIGQQLNTVVGQQYTVSFWWATDGPTSAQSTALQVSWGPDFGADSNDEVVTPYEGTSATTLPYQHMTVSFTGLTAHDILAFHAFDATSDILLDNVTVTSVTSAPASRPWHLVLLAILMSGAAFLVLQTTKSARPST